MVFEIIDRRVAVTGGGIPDDDLLVRLLLAFARSRANGPHFSIEQIGSMVPFSANLCSSCPRMRSPDLPRLGADQHFES